MPTSPIKLYLVVPCYNEEEVLEDTNQKLYNKLIQLQQKNIITNDSKIIYINDGSSDKTEDILNNLIVNKSIGFISLAHNRGHQNALLCGLMYIRDMCDVSISLDADLQDDINAIDEMLQAFLNGADIVYGVRNDRTTDTIVKKMTAEIYYKLLQKLGVETVFNHADYRLMSSKALQILSEYKETNLYLRGIIPQIGLKTEKVYYKRQERLLGYSKYNLAKMINLAVNGITSFSVKPLQIPLILSLLSFILSLIGFILSAVFNNIIILLISCLIFCTSFVLLSLGIIAEYIAKIMLEVKQRPRYTINYVKGVNDD